MKLLKLFLVVFLQIYSETSSESPSIIIVGAGPAGIAAATRLLENGYTNVRVLEAENRVGGRVNSVFFGEAFVDLGAESCHGSKDNVVHQLVQNYNVLRHTEYPTTVYHSQKKNIGKKFGEELVDIIFSIYGPDGQRNQSEGRTVGQYCIDEFKHAIYHKFQNSAEKLQIAKSALDLFQHIVLSYEGAFSWFESSAINDYTDCAGDLDLNWNGFGYKTALEALIKKFPNPTEQLPFDQTVLLNKEVNKVFWSEKSARNFIVLVCTDNTIFTANHLIFTPSIGVLKEKHDKIFSPRLPKSKRDAIQKIGFGAVIKVFMLFENQWWENDFKGFHMIWDKDDEVRVGRDFPEGPFKEKKSWVTQIYSVVPAPKNPQVLVAWITGDMVPEIESLSNETMIRGLSFVLDKFISHRYNITVPKSIIRSFWHSNPRFRGSYSYQTVEARKSRITAEMELAKPLLNKYGYPILHFAGEATHPRFYSTVHGAIETGYREADRIINFYK